MKQSLSRPILMLTCLSLSGCCVFSDTIPVDDAQVFVDEAFKEAMAEVAKLKLRPSKVALSFYADKDVNSVIIKQRKQKTNRLTLTPIEKPALPVQQVSIHQPDIKKELITYNLQCERTQTVTFINCHTIGQASLGLADNRLRLNFQKIQLRQNNRLNILLQPGSDSVSSTSRSEEYNLQCDRETSESYQNCWHLPDTISSGSTSAGERPFSIQQVNMSIRTNQFKVLVYQTIDSLPPIPTPPPQTAAYQPPVPQAPEPEQWDAPKPISFKVLMLRDDSLLLSADQDSLTTDLKKTLGKNYIDHDDYVLTPGEFKFINFTRIDEDTRYVAVIADYRDGANSIWKKAFKVEPTGSTYPLHIHLRRNAVDILAEGE
jgi:type VI secretion system VasD/TssJ family lipoprotein